MHAMSARLPALLMVLALVAARATASGRGLLTSDNEDFGSYGRGLLTNNEGFPFCKCDDYMCESSPYSLRPPQITPHPKGSMICWDVLYRGCDPRRENNQCCFKLRRDLHKIGFNVRPGFWEMG